MLTAAAAAMVSSAASRIAELAEATGELVATLAPRFDP
ncbi:hypothetical protein [Sporisorium scitamineum]|uniref:Uncharacterized protein n=1 Tax=Sporisorium scitamineum TaxID=49012 RepID=A0A0F7RYG8_9BASI|nr:hypothetical protein [Sporisorium scitamineum]